MQIFFIVKPRIYIAIDEGKIFRIEKHKGRIINPYAIRVSAISATPFNRWGVDCDNLYLDGLMLVELMAWLYRQRSKWPVVAFGNRFMSLFDGGDGEFLSETIKATFRAALNLSHSAFGEDAFFVAQQWKQHPQEFGELATAAASMDVSTY